MSTSSASCEATTPTLTFESTDIGQTEEFLVANYAPMRIGSVTPQPSARISRVASDAITVDRVAFDFEMTYDVEELGRIGLCDVSAGTIEGHGPEGSAAENFGPGELFSLAPPDRRYGGTINHARYTVTMIDSALLDQVAGSAAGGVRLLGHRPVGAAAGRRRLRAAIDHVEDAVLSDPATASNPLVLGAAARYLAAQLLAAFPNTAAGARTADSRDARPAALRRAIAFMEDNAHLDITPAQVAAAAHVSIRALQLAFRRHLDTTPMAHLREIRLARTRRDLQEAVGGGGAGVADIAARWGFLHQGHFGQAYRRRYGETPGATLRS